MKKGISLPIEMIVIIAIAVLVLVVIAAFFIGGAGKLGTTNDVTAFGEGCQRWVTIGCGISENGINVPGYNPTGSSMYTDTGDSLATACTRMGYTVGAPKSNPNSCRARCGCPS
jgi:hypothetical protein